MSTPTVRQHGRHVAAWQRLLGRVGVRAMGWQAVGPLPEVPKAIFVAAPHTSNWDGFIMVAIAWSLNLRLSWVGKHTLFKWPFGAFFRFAGGVELNRRAAKDTVKAIADQVAAAGEMYLAVSPPGTRSKRACWRSGFYHIARAADVPLVLGFLDYARKRGGCGPTVHLTGDVRADMDVLRAFYADVRGRYPEQETPTRLDNEDTEMRDAA